MSTPVERDSARQVWDVLSKIDVSDHVEKKNNFSYLSWAWAWGVLMENFPGSKFSFEDRDGNEAFTFPDGTVEVRCILTINGITRKMWLPVMDHKNNAIKNPNARDINDAKMRCLVKAMALFGLGHHIYAGEDLPTGVIVQKKAEAEREADALVEKLKADIVAAADLDALKAVFVRATRFAKNRNNEELLAEFTALKDKRKDELSKEGN